MLVSSIPAKFAIVWGALAGGSFIRTIPQASQIGIQSGAASLTDGFPPLNSVPVASGGVPPFMQDHNGILKQITQWVQWDQAGAPIAWDSSFSTSIGGYPAGAMVASAVTTGLVWISTTDNNTTNPDASGAGWYSATAGRLIGIQTFPNSGTYTPSSTLVGSILARGVGGGAGSGGNPATDASHCACSGAGGSGSYAEVLFTSGFTGGITVTIGAGGTSGSNANGTVGGATTLGTLLTIPGGQPGLSGLSTTGLFAGAAPGAGGATPTASGGGNKVIVADPGQAGATGIILGPSVGFAIPGFGGSTPMGQGNPNLAGTGFGSGGGGLSSPPSTAASSGFAGASGYLVIYEYSR